MRINVVIMILRYSILIVVLFLPFGSYAQDIKVTSKGEGTTREEAVHTALREALERTFNSFISSRTLFSDDEIVADEIVSITRGNILQYEILNDRIDSVSQLHNVIVESIVSLDKFKSYSKSHGSSVEIDGASLVNSLNANEAMKKFNAENEVIAVKNIISEMEQLCQSIYEYQIKVQVPTISNADITIQTTVEVNFNFVKSIEKLYNLLSKVGSSYGSYSYTMPIFSRSSKETAEEMAMMLWISNYRKDGFTNWKNQYSSEYYNHIKGEILTCPACGEKTYTRSVPQKGLIYNKNVGQCSSKKCGYKVTPDQWNNSVKLFSGRNTFHFFNQESVNLLMKYIGQNNTYGPIWTTKFKITDNTGKVYAIKNLSFSSKLFPPDKIIIKSTVSRDDMQNVKSFSIEPIYVPIDQRLKAAERSKKQDNNIQRYRSLVNPQN